MRRFGGQAARGAWAVLRRLLALALGLLLVGGAGFAVLAWWVAERPIEMPWLAARIQDFASTAAAPGRVNVAGATLAWEGFRQGLGLPIDIRLAGVALRDMTNGFSVEAPHVQVALDLGALLHGRLAPRSLAILDARVTLTPATLAASPTDWRAGARAALRTASTLRRIVVRGAQVVTAPGQGWAVPRLDAELTRDDRGGDDAHAALSLTLEGEPAQATLDARLPSAGDAVVTATLGRVRPATLASLWPSLTGAASMLDAPFTASTTLALDSGWAPKALRLDSAGRFRHAQTGSGPGRPDGRASGCLVGA